MNVQTGVVSTVSCVFILLISSCSTEKQQVSSELIQTARALVAKGDLAGASSVLSTVEKMSPNMSEVLELRKLVSNKEIEKTSVKEDPLAYSFMQGGIRVELNGVVKTRNIDSRTGTQLSEGETWIILNTVLKDEANRYHQTNWRGYFRLVTKTGDALSPSIPLIISSQNGTPDFIQGNERKEMKLLFRTRENEGPWKLRFSNGKENNLFF